LGEHGSQGIAIWSDEIVRSELGAGG
jgi:hypothetical protein